MRAPDEAAVERLVLKPEPRTCDCGNPVTWRRARLTTALTMPANATSSSRRVYPRRGVAGRDLRPRNPRLAARRRECGASLWRDPKSCRGALREFSREGRFSRSPVDDPHAAWGRFSRSAH
jgi:hypothetical protein